MIIKHMAALESKKEQAPWAMPYLALLQLR